MIWTSPFAIFFYVVIGFNIVTSIIVRSRTEKEIASFLRLPSDKRTKRIEAYKKLQKTQKIPLIIMPIMVPISIGCHFLVPNDDNAFLFVSGMFAISTIFMIENRHYRKSMIARLENAQAEVVPDANVIEESPAAVAARVRKVKIILFVFMTVFILGPIITLYFTLDMPWWLFLALSAFWFIVMIISIAIGLKRAKKELNSQKANDKQL